MSNGKSSIYDLRADKPIIVKDQQNDLPIKKILFHKSNQRPDLVLTADSKIVKLWHHDEGGKILTSIEPEHRVNDLCVVGGDSGLIFMPTETMKVQVYYIPSLGIAPKWCHFLDNLTEELEENANPEIYDNYKFITQTELETLGLSHLVGTSLLRAYMHGHFIDLRLYRKVKTLADPLAFHEYKKDKVKEKIQAQTLSRIQLSQLPAVNRDLAERMIKLERTRTEDGVLDPALAPDKRAAVKERKKEAKATKAAQFLGDDRFASMFQNPDFQIDKSSEEYKNIQPIVESFEKRVVKKKKDIVDDQEEEEEDEDQVGSEDDDDDDNSDSESSDDEAFQKTLKQKYKEKGQAWRAERERLQKLDREADLRQRLGGGENTQRTKKPDGGVIDGAVKGGESNSYKGDSGKGHFAKDSGYRTVTERSGSGKVKGKKRTLMERIAAEGGEEETVKVTAGGRESTFVPKSSRPPPPHGGKKSFKTMRQEQKDAEYRQRKKERRGAGSILPRPKLPPKFYMGKRVQ